jgi:hypothetical protein
MENYILKTGRNIFISKFKKKQQHQGYTFLKLFSNITNVFKKKKTF